ncbi:hypothetical protein PR202_gb26616 [Eleusine coracana subsp. coracana]|uniref:Uncharacterized protein n=1 Tax=Eleusine coracana subsp. coracana TaxID=191504 RepID=A0AAV5FSC5_ELECO|nr:hypothetical protein PR202_gb26616 [Eleusine coracana subsp. coracana]
MIGGNGEYSLALFSDCGNSVPYPGDGESFGNLPSSTAAAGNFITECFVSVVEPAQENQETYISSLESEEEEEEEEEDMVISSAYSQPHTIPVY